MKCDNCGSERTIVGCFCTPFAGAAQQDNALAEALARADRDRLSLELDEARSLLADLRDWHAHTDEDANEVFERIGEAFYRDTGWLRPGKSESPERAHDPEERRRKFHEWCQRQHAALTERIRAAAVMPQEGEPRA